MKKPLLISFMALGGCMAEDWQNIPFHPQPYTGWATRNKALLINEGSEPGTLDPQAAQSVPEYHIIIDSSKAWLAVT